MSIPHRLTFFEPRDYRVVFVDTKKRYAVSVTPQHTPVSPNISILIPKVNEKERNTTNV